MIAGARAVGGLRFWGEDEIAGAIRARERGSRPTGQVGSRGK